MTFGCEETRRYVDAWIDGELDPGASLLMEAHVLSCAGCKGEAEMIRVLKRSFAALRENDRAPDGLRVKVLATLDAVDASVAQAQSASRRRRHASGIALAGAALAGVVLLTGRNHSMDPNAATSASVFPPLFEEFAHSHARDLPAEVRGNEPTQVADLFRGRVDVPVRPVAFRGVPAQFVGGRISTVHDRDAAALYYDVAGRRTTMFVFDAGLIAPMTAGYVSPVYLNNRPVYVSVSHGYTVAVWQRDGVGYAVATDLPPREAVRLVSEAEAQ